MTYDAFNRVVEQQNGSGYIEYLYSPFGYRLANMNGQAYTTARIRMPAGSAAVYYGVSLPHYYNHADWLGSIRVTSSNLRTVSQDESFAPFGEEYAFNSGNSQAGDVFTGQHRNYVNSGLWDFPLREYFGSQGRWMSPDPAGLAAVNPMNPQTWNRYAYVDGNPLSNVDPSGLCTPNQDCVAHANVVDAISAQGQDCFGDPNCSTYIVDDMEVSATEAMALLSRVQQSRVQTISALGSLPSGTAQLPLFSSPPMLVWVVRGTMCLQHLYQIHHCLKTRSMLCLQHYVQTKSAIQPRPSRLTTNSQRVSTTCPLTVLHSIPVTSMAIGRTRLGSCTTAIVHGFQDTSLIAFT